MLVRFAVTLATILVLCILILTLAWPEQTGVHPPPESVPQI